MGSTDGTTIDRRLITQSLQGILVTYRVDQRLRSADAGNRASPPSKGFIVDTLTWQAVIVTLIVQAAAVALAYVNRNRKTPGA